MLAHTEPRPLLVSRVVLSPIGNIEQKPNGRIVTGVDFGPAKSENTTREHGEEVLRKMEASFLSFVTQRSRR